MPVSILSALHAVATGAVFAYLHLFKQRGCRCVTERPDFCRLYVASAMLFGWRVLLLGLRAARPSVFMYDRSGRPDLLAIGVNAALYLAFFVFFARFAYDVWLGRTLTGATGAAACACATEKRDQRLLGIGSLVYGLAMIVSAAATLVLLTALSVMR